MRRGSLILVLVIVAVLVAIGLTSRGGHGRTLTRWLASLHGSPTR